MAKRDFFRYFFLYNQDGAVAMIGVALSNMWEVDIIFLWDELALLILNRTQHDIVIIRTGFYILLFRYYILRPLQECCLKGRITAIISFFTVAYGKLRYRI